MNFSKIVVLAFLVFLAFTIWLFIKTPTSFLPDEDQGYFIVAAQLPAAASLERTAEIGSKLEEYILTIPGVETVLTINGYSMMGGGAEPNAASLFIVLKPWSERTKKSESAFAITDRINEYCASWQEATVYALVPPPIPGLGVSSGLNFELEDINSYGPFQLQTAVDELVASARDYPEIEMLQTQYQASTPLYMLNINRDKLELMGLSISEVFSTISAYMGSSYVNDYVEFDRIFQVLIQGNAQSRSFIEGVMKLSVKNPSGNMVPVSTFASLVEQVGANDILRYNMYTAASIIAISNPAYSSSQTMVALGDLVKQVLGNNYAYEWTSMAYQEKESSSQVIVILFLAVLLVFLVLSAQYESLLNPIAVLMGVPFAILGAIVGTKVMGLSISLYSQIGIVLLIALSAKNAILIVQFAMDYHAKGESVVNAAIEAGKVRLRPILMTSFAFIFGVMPLMFATGAGARSRIFLGTTVVFGMLFNTLFGTLFIPNFYHFMNERLFGKKKNKNIQQVAQKQN